jgi:hypothetical protein
MKMHRVTEPIIYIYTAVFCSCLIVAVLCSAADFVPTPPDCKALQSSPVTKLDQRIEIAAPGFSILPPQGERWCYRLLASSGASFFKIPPFSGPLEKPSLEEFMARRLFSAMAMSIKGLIQESGDLKNPDELKSFVDRLIREHLFPQVITGLSSGEHRFLVLESNVAIMNLSNAVCVRFDGIIEEQGNRQAPRFVFVLNFPGNVVCRHPAAPETELIWIGFVERYLRGEQPSSLTLKGEYEPFIQSLRFMPPR